MCRHLLAESHSFSPCSPVLLSQVLSVLAGQAESAEVTWRSLYACENGWRGLRPGSFAELKLASRPDYLMKPYPTLRPRRSGAQLDCRSRRRL